jgi:hypothetical protein
MQARVLRSLNTVIVTGRPSLRLARRRRAVPLVALAALAGATFAPALAAGFLSDDYVLLGVLRRAGGIAWVFERNDIGEAGEAGHFYRPLWLLWNRGIYELAGAHPAPFHVANLLLYAALTLEVWFLARRLVGEGRAWFAGVAFAVYPRHGESVAWISGSTDLTAVSLGLGALLCLTSSLRLSARLLSVAALTAAAALSKEIAYVLPVLAAWVVLAAPAEQRDRLDRRGAWLSVALMALVVAVVAVVRTDVVGGIGGYPDHPWTPVRAVAVFGTYVLASVTPPELELFRSVWLLAVPLVLVGLLAWRVQALRRDPESLRVVRLGLVWFGLSLLPLLNLAVDLNNANGERLMLLASVGFALALAGLLPAASSRRAAVGLVAAAGLAFALSFHASFDWVRATRISDRLVDQAARLAPPSGELLLLSGPENYRTAHIFTSGDLAPALRFAGASNPSASICTQVVVRRERSGTIAFTRRADGSYLGRTTWAAPFDFPALRSTTAVSAACPYERADGSSWPIGIGLGAVVTPLPPALPRALAFFDGQDLRRCC